jgi:hypothetical protein
VSLAWVRRRQRDTRTAATVRKHDIRWQLPAAERAEPLRVLRLDAACERNAAHEPEHAACERVGGDVPDAGVKCSTISGIIECVRNALLVAKEEAE